jgi:hypothetical protein
MSEFLDDMLEHPEIEKSRIQSFHRIPPDQQTQRCTWLVSTDRERYLPVHDVFSVDEI